METVIVESELNYSYELAVLHRSNEESLDLSFIICIAIHIFNCILDGNSINV